MSKQKIQTYQTAMNQAQTFLDARQNILSSTEQLESQFDNEMQHLIQTSMTLFEKAADMREKIRIEREYMIQFNQMMDEMINRIFNVAPELENSQRYQE